MTDPYEVLGISRNATDDEVKAAYRNMAKKYHPDNYADAPDIADLAEQKMREVNEAHDAIMKERKNSASGAGASSGGAGYNTGYTGGTSAGYSAGAGSAYAGDFTSAGSSRYSTFTEFANVRKLIMDGRYDDADAVLNSIPADRRSAEWNFLKGTVLYSRGWLEQAYTYLKSAVNMDPNNNEYRAAYNQAAKMRSGSSGGYRMDRSGGNGLCSTCCSLLCMDQCCECCGGDFITCC